MEGEHQRQGLVGVRRSDQVPTLGRVHLDLQDLVLASAHAAAPGGTAHGSAAVGGVVIVVIVVVAGRAVGVVVVIVVIVVIVVRGSVIVVVPVGGAALGGHGLGSAAVLRVVGATKDKPEGEPCRPRTSHRHHDSGRIGAWGGRSR